jgi:hypothetical protein
MVRSVVMRADGIINTSYDWLSTRRYQTAELVILRTLAGQLKSSFLKKRLWIFFKALAGGRNNSSYDGQCKANGSKRDNFVWALSEALRAD